MKHVIPASFENDLLVGFLKPLLERVQNDHSLMLCTREKHINIYYRGGNLINLSKKSEKHSGCLYMATFSEGYKDEYEKYYSKYDNVISLAKDFYNQPISDASDVKKLIQTIPLKKEIMDFYFSGKSPNGTLITGDPIELEGEFQQLVARENNYSKAPDMTDYFIADIELKVEKGPRFDMLALKHPTTSQSPNNYSIKIALVEMKYGSKSITGEKSISKHFVDMQSFLSDGTQSGNLVKMAKEQIDQLKKMGLMNHKFGTSKFDIDSDHFEIIFILANHIPQGKERETLLAELDKIKMKLLESDKIDLRFFTANSAGYGMYDACMKDIDKYIELVQKQK
jgi:hypothetical protein